MNTLYILTSPSNKIYVGVTTRFTRRIWEHKRATTPIGYALRKYGLDNFKVDKLEFDTIEEAFEMEELMIGIEEVRSKRYYNQIVGGLGSATKHRETNPALKEENIRKRSERMRTDLNPMRDPEARNAHKNSMAQESYREFHRALTTKRMKDPEAKEIAVAPLLKANAQRQKRIQAGNVCFLSVRAASDHIGRTRSTIRDRIKSSKWEDYFFITD